MKKLKSFLSIIIAIIFSFSLQTTVVSADFFPISNPTPNSPQTPIIKKQETAKTTSLQKFFQAKKKFYNTVVGPSLKKYEGRMLNNQFDDHIAIASKIDDEYFYNFKIDNSSKQKFVQKIIEWTGPEGVEKKYRNSIEIE